MLRVPPLAAALLTRRGLPGTAFVSASARRTLCSRWPAARIPLLRRARSSRLLRPLGFVRHVWRPVLFIPSVMILLQWAAPGAAQRIEDLGLQIAFAVTGEPSVDQVGASLRDRRVPLIVEIGKPLFVTAFRERTPLDRTQLRRLVDELLRSGPRTLVIDIDLSPLAGANPAEQAAQQALDELLRDAARAGRTRIVLITPLGTPPEAAGAVTVSAAATQRALHAWAKEQLDWMHAHCAATVHFGLNTLYSVGGAVLRYDRSLPTLGVLAAHLDGYRKEAPDFRRRTPCGIVAQRDLESAYFLFDLPDGRVPGDTSLAWGMRPVNAAYLRFAAQLTARPQRIDRLPTPAPLEGRTVFLGGSYGTDVRQSAAATFHAGVAMHAAQYFSETRPTLPVPHAVAFLVEVLVGLVAAALLHRAWGWYFASRYVADPSLAAVLASHARGALVIACSVGLLVLAFFLTTHTLQRGAWLNPQPLALGIILKSLLSAWSVSLDAYRAGSGAPDAAHADSHASSWRTCIATLATVLVAAAAVAHIAIVDLTHWRHAACAPAYPPSAPWFCG